MAREECLLFMKISYYSKKYLKIYIQSCKD